MGEADLQSPGVGTRRRPRPALGLVALAAVLAVSLAIGGGLFSQAKETNAQRAAAIDHQLRCPSCIDETVAQSSASAAVAVRREVAAMVGEGRSAQQIDTALVSQYGATILLRPPTSGLAALVWIVPALAGAVALGALVVLFWRRSREMDKLRREERA